MFSKKFGLLLSSILAIVLCHFVGVAQVQNSPTATTVEINGQVRFAEGGAPAQNVVVRLESYDSGGSISEAFTDRLGKFRFTNLPPAQYSVRVHQTGYRDAQQSVDMTTSSRGLAYLQLMPEGGTARSSTSATGTVDAHVPAGAQKEFDKGVEALKQGGKDKTELAARFFEKAVSLYPQFVQARLKLGTAYMDLGEWDKAEHALLSTIEVDANAFNALFALGEIYLRQGKLADAEKVVLKGLAIQDASYLGHLSLARIYWVKARAMKELAEAKPTLEKSYDEVKKTLTLNPKLADAYVVKGNLLLRVGRSADALVAFNEYLRLEPHGPLADETRALVEKIKKATAQSR
jgi:Flp pilus assembly protein TadD